MKKRILLVIIFLYTIAFNFNSQAQSCTPIPWYTSGNTVGTGPNIFGTLDANDVLINGDSYQIGIITGNHTSSNYGNYEIGINGTLPQNKLLVENGTISTATGCGTPSRTGPYADLCNFPAFIGTLATSDIAIYSYSNNTGSGANNVGVSASANANGAAIGIGYIGMVSNAVSNTGMVLQVKGTTGSTNMGEFVEVTGATNNQSQGAIFYTTGSTTENDGIQGAAIGATSMQNLGVQGNAQGSTTTNIGVYGTASSTLASNVLDIALKGYANGDGSFNQGFQGGASGNSGALNVGIYSQTNGNNNNTWSGLGSALSTNLSNFGIYSATYGQNSVDIGGQSEVLGILSTDLDGSALYGFIGDCAAVSTSTCTSQIGLWGAVLSSPLSSTANYGVLGTAPNGGAGGGVYSPTNAASPVAPSYAGYFEGDIFCTNTYYYSDPKLKENISDYTGAMDLLNKMPIKRYTYNTKAFPSMNLPQGENVGILSTDMKQVCPGLVKPGTHLARGKGDQQVSFDAVNYNALIPVLVEAVKELDAKTSAAQAMPNAIQTQQQAQIEQLMTDLGEQTKQISDLKNMLNDICNLGCPGLQNSNGNGQAVVLFQSIPNPTSGSATIGYVINVPFTSALISVTSTDGNTVQDFKITQGGKGSVVFDGSQLASGTFRYSLYIDGKLYDTKSIVITKD